jgi:predicted phage baseplate assembly protein
MVFDEGDDAGAPPFVRTLLPNTTLASQTLTALNEPLGSSDATAGQQFRTARAPVLASQRLEVREPPPLTSEEIEALEAAHGETDVVTPDTGGTNEVWVRWIEVPDLYASAPTDRHYVLDHISGAVRFGDGAQGRIPPRGAGNIRMARYQTGGGSVGNVEAGTVVQMKTTVPFVEKVVNLAAAAGGFGAESVDELRARAPRTLRHGGRAVAAEDYEDIARLASSEVARATCVPLRLLKTDLLGKNEADGALSLIILPATSDPKPLPSAELLTRVAQFVSTRQAVNAQVDVVGPLYVRVDVTLEVALTRPEGASQIEQAIRAKLAAFLHPLTGGRDGTGWDFGREPHTSDLHAIVAVPGVDHVRQLSLAQVEEVEGSIDAGRFLIYSGQHQITLTLAGTQ